jgi:BolA protein
MRNKIIAKLEENLNCNLLEVIDESYLHQGHIGYHKNGETHFKIIISSPDLQQLKKIDAHRKINKILQEEINSIHALSLEIK